MVNVNKQTLIKALDSASCPVIAALMVHFTGDISVLDRLPRPKQSMMGEVQGFLTAEEKTIFLEGRPEQKKLLVCRVALHRKQLFRRVVLKQNCYF